MNRENKAEKMFSQIQFGIKLELDKGHFIIKEAFFPDEVKKGVKTTYVVNRNFKRWFAYKEEYFEEATSEIIYARDVLTHAKCGSIINELSRAIISLKEVDVLREMDILSKTQTNRFLTTDQSMLVRIIDVDWVGAAWYVKAHSIIASWPIGLRTYMR
jgi:hypothetical protein